MKAKVIALTSMALKCLGCVPFPFKSRPCPCVMMPQNKPDDNAAALISAPNVFRGHLCANCHPQCHLRHDYHYLQSLSNFLRCVKGLVLKILRSECVAPWLHVQTLQQAGSQTAEGRDFIFHIFWKYAAHTVVTLEEGTSCQLLTLLPCNVLTRTSLSVQHRCLTALIIPATALRTNIRKFQWHLSAIS